jgi:hypothetical protein
MTPGQVKRSAAAELPPASGDSPRIVHACLYKREVVKSEIAHWSMTGQMPGLDRRIRI